MKYVASFVTAALATGAVAQPPKYRLEVIEPPSGTDPGAGVLATSITNSGLIGGYAGWTNGAGRYRQRAIIVGPSSSRVIEPVLPDDGDGDVERDIVGLTESGWAAVHEMSRTQNINLVVQNGTVTRLSAFDGGFISGIDAAGNVGGKQGGKVAAILNGQFVSLPDGGVGSGIFDVGESGLMVGYDNISTFNLRAATWRNGIFQPLEEMKDLWAQAAGSQTTTPWPASIRTPCFINRASLSPGTASASFTHSHPWLLIWSFFRGSTHREPQWVATIRSTKSTYRGSARAARATISTR